MVGDLRRATAAIPDTQKRMLQVTGTATSSDRLIKVTVGPRGQLLDLDIDPRVFRKPDARALSAEILAAVRLAVEDAARQTSAILAESLPADMRSGAIGGIDITTLISSHDADVRVKGDDDE